MMHTPSLRNRIVLSGAAVLTVVLVGVNALMFVLFRAELHGSVHDVLEQQVATVRAEAQMGSGPDLARRLSALGMQATVRTPDGTAYRSERSPSGPRPSSESIVTQLADGSVVTIYANPHKLDETNEKLLVIQGVGLLVAELLAALLLMRISKVVVRPLAHIAASARRTSRGQRGERLQPDRPDTSLGQLATAYDEMLESLETSEKHANDALVESELLYVHLRQVIETANAAFVAMDASGVITDWNSKAEEVFGWTRGAIVGQPLVETLVPPALRAAHSAGMRRFFESGEHKMLGTTAEFEALHRDGHLIPVEVSTWVTYVGDEVTFTAFLRDLTARKKGEEAISSLASIVETAQEAIFSCSLDGTILTWNLGAERTYGYTADEAIGRHHRLIVPSECNEEIERVRDQIRRGERVARYETVRRRKDGSLVDVAITCSPIFDRWGTVTGASTIGRDITDQRRMAAALDRTMRALESALDDARESEERSRRFLADAAHQLRGPIAGVRACAETLLRGPGESDSDLLLADLVREVSRAGRLISALLRLARIDQGVTPKAEACDVVTICESEVDRTRVLAPGLDVSMEIDGVPGADVELDGNSLTEILSNLLDNARRHARTRLRLHARADNQHLNIAVSDDGSGVADDAVGHIFDRFVSLDGKGGSGLGLPIARALAQAHGGDVTYRRDDAFGGACFVVTLRVKSDVRGEASLLR